MMKWIKDHFLEAVGIALALLTWLGIQPSDIASNVVFLAPLLYVAAGALIGWGLCRGYHGFRSRLHGSADDKRDMTIEDFSENFGEVDFEVKAFLKTVLTQGAAYRRSDDAYAWEGYLEYISQFVTSQTIRNGVSKYTMRSDAKKLFKDNPELLEAVSDHDVKLHAIKGQEGDPHQSYGNGFYWWYYSDDIIEPKVIMPGDYPSHF